MKKYYVICLVAGALLTSFRSHAQYTFNDAAGGLSPYKQDFNSLSGTVSLTGNHLISLPEVYAQAEFSGTAYNPTSIAANDGSTTDANYYHFGYGSGTNATDRSFGGIASTTTINGIGYVGIRFKNATASTTIKNLEVTYAMEQWYNSGRVDAAQVDFSYLTSAAGSSVTSLQEATGTWVKVPALQVKAPSTATSVTSRDGNSAANRRLVSTTITGLNLAPGQEIMLRWAYSLNNTTNGNGLSIDDVAVTPETNTFYSRTSGDLNDLQNWDQTVWTSGQTAATKPPTSFTADNQIFYVMSPGTATSSDAGTDRISVTNTQLGSTWTVSGANSKVIVGSASTAAGMRIEYNKNVAGTIDLSPGSYLVHRRTATNGSIGFTLGTLAGTSTVEYNSNSSTHSIQPVQYGNLKITGSNSDRSANAKMLFNKTVVTGTLSVGDGSNLVLGDNDLTVISSGTVGSYSAAGYVVTNGAGRLRQQVPRASSTAVGTQVVFPVGTSYTSYTPVTLQQTSAVSDDVFEVRVGENVYSSYDATYAPGGTQYTSQVVNKTWYISKETTNSATVTMTTQWAASEAASDFTVATAHINHYTGGAWDTYTTEKGATGSGPYVMKRSGISSFSPFGVSSRTDGTLPVELVAFGAVRAGSQVQCAWTTASEQNSRLFEVQRSLDGQQFAALGQVAAAGSSASTRTYAYADTHPAATRAYYRLRLVDQDGTAAYSPTVAVAAGETSAALALPNPTAGTVTLLATGITAAEVLNPLGQRVAALPGLAPTNSLALDLSAQPAGLYLVRLSTSQGTQLVRVVKH